MLLALAVMKRGCIRVLGRGSLVHSNFIGLGTWCNDAGRMVLVQKSRNSPKS
jgi:hypothetical protein